MSIICNDTQLVLLSAASQRDDHCLVPPPGPKRAQAQRAVAKLVEAGLVKEIRAKAGGPIWRRDDETGQTFALKLTAAGAKAIAVDETGPSEGEADDARTIRSSPSIRRPNPVQTQQQPLTGPIAASRRPQSLRAAEPRSRRSSSCCSVAMVRLAELIAATGWLPHRRGPRSPACASAATPSGLIVPTRREDQSIGLSRRNGGDSAAPTLRRRRPAKRRGIGLNVP